METISQVLFWISNGLLVPVVVILLAFFLRAIVLCGTFFSEFMRRRAERSRLESLLGNGAEHLEEGIAGLPETGSPLHKALGELLVHRKERARCEHILSNYEVEAQRKLGQSRTLAKVGPMLGLMGTLIPMGPALVSLAAGNLDSMARNMQVAFATTVVGLFTAAIGIVTLQVQQRWFARELNDLEFVNAMLGVGECDAKA